MRGLDPRIHDELQRSLTLQQLCSRDRLMECRVKPGNDRDEGP
jgi:hypothetical protein